MSQISRFYVTWLCRRSVPAGRRSLLPWVNRWSWTALLIDEMNFFARCWIRSKMVISTFWFSVLRNLCADRYMLPREFAREVNCELEPAKHAVCCKCCLFNLVSHFEIIWYEDTGACFDLCFIKDFTRAFDVCHRSLPDLCWQSTRITLHLPRLKSMGHLWGHSSPLSISSWIFGYLLLNYLYTRSHCRRRKTWDGW